MDHQKIDINRLYSDLLIDNDFEQLSLIRNKPNIFETLGVKSYEIRHSNFLAWLLDPNGNHGLKNYFLKRFLINIFKDVKSKIKVIDIHNLLEQNILIHRERFYIDLLVEFDNAVVIIENKINAVEGSGQLKRYREVVSKNYSNHKNIECVFLTKDGYESSIPEHYITMSYDDIRIILEDVLLYNSDNLNLHTKIYISDYIDNLKKNILQMDPANKLAEKIYLNHKELFDFIYSSRPNSIEYVKKIFNKFLEKDGYIIGSKALHFTRFITREIREILPPDKSKRTPWYLGEVILIELIYRNQDGKIEFKIAISPAKKELNEYLVSLLKKDDFFCDHDGDWKIFNTDFIDFDFNLFDDELYIAEKHKEIIDLKLHLINKLNHLIVTNAEELRKFYL